MFNLPFSVRIADNSPIDGDRYIAPTIALRDALITVNRAYEGLQVYVEADQTLYILKGATIADWEVLGGAGADNLGNHLATQDLNMDSNNINTPDILTIQSLDNNSFIQFGPGGDTENIVIQSNKRILIGDNDGEYFGTNIDINSENREIIFNDADIETGRTLSIFRGASTNPFDARLNINQVRTGTGNEFPVYNSINKTNSINSSALVYGISNLIEHDGSGDISQLRGVFNRVRSDGTGTPGEMISFFNQASYRNMGTGTVPLLSASENFVIIEESGSVGTITSAIGVRGQINMNSASETLSSAFGGLFQLDLNAGTVGSFIGVSIDIDQSVGTTINSGAYLQLETGSLVGQNLKAINSLINYPSYFEGIIESNKTIAELDAASGLTLPNKDWVLAQIPTISAEGLQETLEAGGNFSSTPIGLNTITTPSSESDNFFRVEMSDAGFNDSSVFQVISPKQAGGGAVSFLVSNTVLNGSSIDFVANQNGLDFNINNASYVTRFNGSPTRLELDENNVIIRSKDGLSIQTGDNVNLIPTVIGQVLTATGINGECTWQTPSGGGSNIFTANGTFTGTRTATIPDEASINFIAATANSAFNIDVGTINLDFSGQFNLHSASGLSQINMQNSSHIAIIANNGLRLTLPVAPTAGQILTAVDGNGDLIWSTPSGGGGNSIYSANDSIPTATDREVTIPVGSSLAFNNGTTEVYIYDSGFSLDGSDLAFSNTQSDSFINISGGNALEVKSEDGLEIWSGTAGAARLNLSQGLGAGLVELISGPNGINFSGDGNFELLATHGLQIRPGIAGTITPTVVGQVLTATGTSGECTWQTLSQFVTVDTPQNITAVKTFNNGGSLDFFMNSSVTGINMVSTSTMQNNLIFLRHLTNVAPAVIFENRGTNKNLILNNEASGTGTPLSVQKNGVDVVTIEETGKITATQLNLNNLPVHADDTAAGVAGLILGDVYRTATGELRIKL